MASKVNSCISKCTKHKESRLLRAGALIPVFIAYIWKLSNQVHGDRAPACKLLLIR